MSDTAADLRRCLDILDGWGTPIVQVPGWETRGKGAMTTRGHLEHHTAGGRRSEERRVGKECRL